MITYLKTVLESIRDREEGQGLVEYALILGLIAVGTIVALGFIGDDVKKALEDIAGAL